MKYVKSGMTVIALGLLALLSGCASGPELKNTVWTPVKLENQGDTGLIQDQPVWFAIDKNDKVSGNGGTNMILGSTVAAGDGKLVFDKLATTRATGPNIGYENLFLKTLNETRTYRIDGDNLQLYGKDGNLLATFTVGSQSFKTEKK